MTTSKQVHAAPSADYLHNRNSHFNTGATKIKKNVEAPGHRPNKGPRAQIGRIKKNRGRPLALPCLAYLASDRPRSPCLHLATTARPPSAAGRRGAPLLLLLLVQARRARPMRGEVSQASQGLVHTTHVLLGLSRLETFSEICALKKSTFLDVFREGSATGI